MAHLLKLLFIIGLIGFVATALVHFGCIFGYLPDFKGLFPLIGIPISISFISAVILVQNEISKYDYGFYNLTFKNRRAGYQAFNKHLPASVKTLRTALFIYMFANGFISIFLSSHDKSVRVMQAVTGIMLAFACGGLSILYAKFQMLKRSDEIS